MSAPITSSLIAPSPVLPLAGDSNDTLNSIHLRQVNTSSSPRVDPQPQPLATTTPPILSQQPTSSVQTPSNTAITSSSDMRHPHLNEDLQEPIQSMLIGHKSQAEITVRAINVLKTKGIINNKGEICILGHKVSGKMFKAEDGSFDFHITGPCSDNSVKELQNLKDKCISAFTEAGIPKEEAEQLVRGIIPDAAKPLSPSDLEVLNNGGCIQYCATDKGYVKMVLNPKDEGGLTLTCFSRSSEGTIFEGVSQTIPADVIFEGKEANGYKVEPPTLPNWKQRLEAIKSEDQQKSQLAENDIWNAVTQYLKHNINGSDVNITGTRISNQTPDNETLNTLHATNSAPTENSQNTPATNSDIKNFTIEQMTNKINTLFQGIQGASISKITPNFAKIALLKEDECFKGAQNILAKNRIQGEQLKTTLSKLLSKDENGKTSVNSNLRALAIGIARLKEEKDFLEKKFSTTEIQEAQKQTTDAIKELTNDFIALAEASTTQQ